MIGALRVKLGIFKSMLSKLVNTVHPNIFASILFSGTVLKDMFVMLKVHDWSIYLPTAVNGRERFRHFARVLCHEVSRK